VPRDTERQKYIRSRIIVSPQPIVTNKHTDYFGNESYHFEIQTMHTELSIAAESEIKTKETILDLNVDFGMSYGEALELIDTSSDMDIINAREFCIESPIIRASKALADYARPSFVRSRSLNSCVAKLTNRIYSDFTYTPAFTNTAKPLS
jgi:transglutaminase-like putative cysteine protease